MYLHLLIIRSHRYSQSKHIHVICVMIFTLLLSAPVIMDKCYIGGLEGLTESSKLLSW